MEFNRSKSDKLIEEILQSYQEHPESTRFSGKNILNRELLIDILYKIREILFPGFYDKNRVRAEYVRYLVGEKIEYIQYNLTKQVSLALGTRDICEECPRSVLMQKAEKIVDTFLQQIPVLRE